MATRLIQLTAGSLDELNQVLREITGSPQLLPLQLSLETPGWSPTAWELTFGPAEDLPNIQIHGISQIQQIDALMTPLACNAHAQQQRLQIEPVWPGCELPERQTITISSSHGDATCTAIRATNAPSPWQVLQLLRRDVARPTLQPMLRWLCSSGLAESNLLRQSPALLHALNARIPGTQQRCFESMLWQRADLQAEHSSVESASFRHWLKTQAPIDHHWPPFNASGALSLQRTTVQPWAERPYGVNLFGYASEALGIGEDLRTCRIALETAGVPVQVVDIPIRPSSTALRQQAREAPDTLAPYAVNLFCLTAEEHARVLMELGSSVMEQRYNIGYWPWELSRWPKAWQPLLALVDEVWASSRFIEQGLAAAIGSRPGPQLRRLPLPLQPLEPLTPVEKHYWRRRYGLPQDRPLVICSFDGRSSYARKNPWAAIAAFLEACPATDPAEQSPHLVIKTMHGGLDPEHWQRLEALAQRDQRLHIIDAVLPREHLLGLYGSCDVLLSLHRSEGYGRVLAEALLLGLHVVATDYSGNRDFCLGPLVHPVPYTLVPVGPGEYPHGDGQQWAEPDHAQAVQQLRTALTHGSSDGSASDSYALLFSARGCGQRYHQRLQHITASRNSTQPLRWT
jgi:glycosyltransferase involved in cell wall biosynthesis